MPHTHGKHTRTHVHKYERGTIGKDGHEVYRCMLLGCPHYLPNLFLAINRLSLCWGNCGNAVMLTQKMVYHDKTKRPLCDSCRELRAQRKANLAMIPKETDVNTN